jgi:hypothetical protein
MQLVRSHGAESFLGRDNNPAEQEGIYYTPKPENTQGRMSSQFRLLITMIKRFGLCFILYSCVKISLFFLQLWMLPIIRSM